MHELTKKQSSARLGGWASRSLGTIAALAVMMPLTTTSGVAAQQQEEVEPGEAESELPVLLIRPHAGVGWASSYSGSRAGNGLAFHAGGRVLFPAGKSQRFGLEATYLDLDISDSGAFRERYVVLGIVLEMTLFDNFLLGIGTVGYVGLGDTDGNPFGVVTNLGWEPAWKSTVLPFVTLRSEWVFDDVVFNILSLSVGITFQL